MPTTDTRDRTTIGTDRDLVLSAGTYGRHTFRIPALVGSGTDLIAFAEGRTHSASDSGEIAIVGSVSSDGGRTWSEPTTLTEQAGYTCGNPAPIVLGDGRIALLSCRNGADRVEFELKGPGVPPLDSRRVFRQWITAPRLATTPPEDITDAVKPTRWGWYATGPGHGIRLRSGPHEGRLVVACNHSDTSGVNANSFDTDRRQSFETHGLFSDDDGATWQIGYCDPGRPGFAGPNESTAAELSSGEIVISVRNGVDGDVATRGQAVSADGAESLAGPVRPQPELTMVPISCSLATIELDGQEVLVLSGLTDPNQRRGLALRFSSNGGGSWSAPVVIDPGPTAYSDLFVDPAGALHVIWESGVERPPETIVHTTIMPDRLRELCQATGGA